MAKATKTNPVVADICLYGNSQTGAGWIVAMNREVVDVPVWSKGLIGTGEPTGQPFTEAVWAAMDHVLAAAGNIDGQVRIFHPGGETMTVVALGDIVPNYGTLVGRRVPAPVLVLTTDALFAAGHQPAERN